MHALSEISARSLRGYQCHKMAKTSVLALCITFLYLGSIKILEISSYINTTRTWLSFVRQVLMTTVSNAPIQRRRAFPAITRLNPISQLPTSIPTQDNQLTRPSRPTPKNLILPRLPLPHNHPIAPPSEIHNPVLRYKLLVRLLRLPPIQRHLTST